MDLAPDVSIVILSKNAGRDFRTTLTKIYDQQTEHRFELLIVDSGSTDESLVGESYPPLLVEPERRGRTRSGKVPPDRPVFYWEKRGAFYFTSEAKGWGSLSITSHL